jgi:hypothetical protein
MQIAHAKLTITPENKIQLYDLTPADALILHALHFKEAKGNPLSDIQIVGEAQTEISPAVPASPAEYTVDHILVRPASPGRKAETRKRTDAEERALLEKFYTGQIEGKSAVKVILPDRTRPLPQTFAEVAEFIGNPEITDLTQKAESENTESGNDEPAPSGEGELPAPTARRRR